jgi:hypothetical protein
MLQSFGKENDIIEGGNVMRVEFPFFFFFFFKLYVYYHIKNYDNELGPVY